MPNPEIAPALVEADPLALTMLAAWVNVPVDKLPTEMRAPSCKHTMAAWKRVGEAALAYHRAEQQPARATTWQEEH